MSDAFPVLKGSPICASAQAQNRPLIYRLQGVTLAWMLVECGVSLFAAATAHSAALLAFGADSLVELLSASVVLLAFAPSLRITQAQAAQWAGILLFVLAGLVGIAATVALLTGARPGTSCGGIWITAAALIVMPVLAWCKRKAASATGNRALAADAVQSATCAYLAAITLISLGVSAVFHIPWVDAAAALAAIPILIAEGRRALRGEPCGCC